MFSDSEEDAHQTGVYPRGIHPIAFPTYLYPHGTFALDGIALRACGLGFVCAIALGLAYQYRAAYPQLPLFVAALSLFHFLEFWVTARYNTRRAKVDAFILTNNGAAYHVAHTAALVEAIVEYYLIPSWKASYKVSVFGFILVVAGQLARTLAMKHAGANFSHFVAQRKEESHRLVQDGIYRFLRHPSYFGYFWWALGTQIMLGNPICLVGFTIVLWSFFSSRIRQEEALLKSFFPTEYGSYRRKTWTGIPAIP